MRCVAAPECRLDVDVDEAEHRRQPIADAAPVLPTQARLTFTARSEHFDRDPLTGRDAPTRCSLIADLLEHPHDLVARDEGERSREMSAVLLVIGAAQAARLDAQDRRVCGDVGDGKRASLEAAFTGEDERFSGHASSNPTWSDPGRSSILVSTC